MSQPIVDYLQYVRDVLGVRQVIEPHQIVEAEEDLSPWATTRTGHWPPVGEMDLCILNVGSALFEGESAALWEKMKAAMKIQGRRVLEVETQQADVEGVLLRILEAYPASVSLILSEAPARSDSLRVLGSSKVLESFSPSVLLQSPDLKKTAWADLQIVMRSL